MATFEYSETLNYSASDIFTALTDLEARPLWIKGLLEVRVTPAGPAQPGTSYYESGKFSGFKSEKTMYVTQFEQDRILILSTPDDASNPFQESYRLEAISEHSCHLTTTVDVGNVPRVAEFFMQQEMKKSQPKNIARLKELLASRS